MTSKAAETIPQPTGAPGDDFTRRAVFIGAGILFVSLGYPDTGVGDLPLRYVLSHRVGIDERAMSVWFMLVNIPSWMKPVIGVASDAIPLFGTRRRHYLLAAALLGAAGWGLMGVVPATYVSLLLMGFFLNACCTVCGTVHGGVVVEEGRKRGMTGRLASVRSACSGLGGMIVSPLAGYLAALAFGWTCAVGALLLLALWALTYACLHEPRTARPDHGAWPAARAELATLARSRTLWVAGLLMFLLRVAPGFTTPLFYYQDHVLRFSSAYVGWLGGAASLFGILAGALYYALCRRFPLRTLLYACVLADIVTTLGYLMYHSAEAAMVIRAASGLGNTLSFLAVFDLTARATPRGSEAMGYSILYAFVNVAMAGSDVFGTWLYTGFGRHFGPMVWINAGTTALILLAVPRLPRALVDWTDGQRPAPDPT